MTEFGNMGSDYNYSDVTVTSQKSELDEENTKTSVDFPERACEMLKCVESWNFNVFEFNNETKEPLRYISYYLFHRHDLLRKFEIDPETFNRFIIAMEKGYNTYNNPYHNNIHAADVVQTISVILVKTRLITCFTDLELFAALFGAIIHDYDHNGKTNNFLVATESDLAMIYNDRSVQENHHLSSTFLLLKEDKYNILSNLSPEDYRQFRSLVIDLVLATDMAFHFQILKDIKYRIRNIESTTLGTKALCLVLHTADISNGFKKYPLNTRWIDMIYEEFFAQGDLERKLNIPITTLFNRETVVIPEAQINFLDFVVKPTFRILADMANVMLKKVGKKERNKIRKLWFECFVENRKKYHQEIKQGRKLSGDDMHSYTI